MIVALVSDEALVVNGEFLAAPQRIKIKGV